MGCSFCKDPEKKEALSEFLVDIRGREDKLPSYCPYCGQPFVIRDMLDTIDLILKRLRLKIPETTVIDGKRVEYDRSGMSKFSLEDKEPMDMTIDLDNVDISKEMVMISNLTIKILTDILNKEDDNA